MKHSYLKKDSAMREICDAIEAGSLNSLLLAKPHLLRESDSLGDLPLHAACSARYQTTSELHTLQTIETLAEHYPEALATPNAHGMLPLHLACWFNENDLIRKLIELYPPALNEADENGYRPVSFVIGKMAMSNESWEDSKELFSHILRLAPDSLWYTDQQGVLPLQYACWNGGIGERLLKLYQQVTQDQGGLSRVVNEKRQTPVQVAACSSTRLDIIQQIHKADPDAILPPDRDGKLPLHYCMDQKFVHHYRKYFQAKLEWLMDVHPQAIAQQDHQGQTPLHHILHNPTLFYKPDEEPPAANCETTQAFSFLASLLAHSDSTRQKDRNEWLAAAVEQLATPRVCALPDQEGNLPLHLAVQHHSQEGCWSELIPDLLQHHPGAVLAKNAHGKTALDLALQAQANKGCTLNTVFALVNYNPCGVIQEYS